MRSKLGARHLAYALFLMLLPASQNCTPNSQAATFASRQCLSADDPSMEPVEKFHWDHEIGTYPEWNQVMATPVVGDIQGTGTPLIIFTSYTGDKSLVTSTYTGRGILRAISGKDGHEIFSRGEDDIAPIGSTTPLLIDIDGDGKAEIIYMHYSLQKVIALNSDGSTRWIYALKNALRSCYGGLSAADLYGDGKAEILVENMILREDANHKSVSMQELSASPNGTSCTAFAMSLDPAKPKELQIVNGRGVYAPSGKLLWKFPNQELPSHRLFLAAGDVRADIPGVEVVTVDQGFVTLYNGVTGETIWSAQTPTDPTRFEGMPGRGGPPNISDVDGDGKPEIGVANAVYYSIFDNRGQLKWTQPNHDYSSNVTGSSVFDFNGDGATEVLYADEGYLKIFNGPTGTTLATVRNPSHTLLENPVVADVDGDGHADLVVVANDVVNAVEDLGEEGEKINAVGSGLRVFKSRGETAWVATRKIWNQYAYFVSNVDDHLRATSATPVISGHSQRTFRQNTMNQFESPCARRN